MSKLFGDVITENGCLIKAGDFVVYTSKEGYDQMAIFEDFDVEEMITEIKEKLKWQKPTKKERS